MPPSKGNTRLMGTSHGSTKRVTRAASGEWPCCTQDNTANTITRPLAQDNASWAKPINAIGSNHTGLPDPPPSNHSNPN
jgi:hypothetical protein